VSVRVRLGCSSWAMDMGVMLDVVALGVVVWVLCGLLWSAGGSTRTTPRAELHPHNVLLGYACDLLVFSMRSTFTQASLTAPAYLRKTERGTTRR
jgi:hypothetical protein